VKNSHTDANRRLTGATRKGASTSQKPKKPGLSKSPPWLRRRSKAERRKPALWVTMQNHKAKASQRAQDVKVYKQRVSVWKQTAGGCRKCEKKQPIECHHTRGRAGKLLLTEKYWIPLCERCHRWVHQNIKQARLLNLICEKGKWGNEN